ncbi:hypothetical protein MaudMau93_002329 [Microsporum audouinii]
MSEYTPLAKWTLITSWTLTVLGFLSIALSVFVYRKVGFDVALVIASFILTTVLVALSTWAIVDEGQGMHEQDISTAQLDHIAKSLLVSEVLWSIVNSLMRIAACLFLRKIFKVCDRFQLLAIASVLQVFLMCRPFAANWDKTIPGACGNQMISFMVFESFGLALDVAILAIPAWQIMMLRLSFHSRLGVIALLDVSSPSMLWSEAAGTNNEQKRAGSLWSPNKSVV